MKVATQTKHPEIFRYKKMRLTSFRYVLLLFFCLTLILH